VARMVLTTETAIVDKPANEDEHAGHHHATLTKSSASRRKSPRTPGVSGRCNTAWCLGG